MFEDRLPATFLSELTPMLAGVDFPATRDEIVEMVQVNGGAPVLVDRLKDLPARSFDTPGDLNRALGIS